MPGLFLKVVRSCNPLHRLIDQEVLSLSGVVERACLEHLRRGLRPVIFSLNEIVFIHIRFYIHAALRGAYGVALNVHPTL